MGTKHKLEKSDTENSSNNEEKGTSPKKKKLSPEAAVDSGAAEGAADGGGQRKKYRKRKRHYYNAIRAQMEFYFGDANLSKDRFLRKLIDKEPFVPLELFLTFNKMKNLTNSVAEIAKALTNSELLELDEAQRRVRRRTPLAENRNVDEKTLYVEALPSSADHDWVRHIFERFGPVAYVSLPKYAKSRKIKEFGFVEFEEEASVAKAVKVFKEFNGVLCMESLDPAELVSVKAYHKEQSEEVENIETSGNINTRKRNKCEKLPEEPVVKKLKVNDTVNDKTMTTGDESSSVLESEVETVKEGGKEESGKEESENISKKKHCRKKKKSQSAEKRRRETELNTDVAYYELKILPKRDWKRLRNKYLNLQREKISELKRKAWKEQETKQLQGQEQIAETATDAAPAGTVQLTNKHVHSEHKLQRMSMNFYGAGEDESPSLPTVKISGGKESKRNPALERAPLFQYEPGLIVEVAFMEPCVNIKEFKADMHQYNVVKYVDVKEGSMYGNLRLESPQAAEDFINKINCAEYKCKILTGEAETEYWQKIERDREMKLNKLVKVAQKRGREKIKKLISKHIRFGDDDE